MIVTYDPDKQGRMLSEDELKKLIELKPECTSFSTDEPELTEQLVERMKKSGVDKSPASAWG